MPNPDSKVGRPLKFPSVEELQAKIDSYFADCDPHVEMVDRISYEMDLSNPNVSRQILVKVAEMTQQKPYTVTGLARYLETSRETLVQYSEKDQFVDTINKAKDKIHEYVEQYLFSGKNNTGAIFSLKNNWGWKDESGLELNPSGKPVGVVYLPKRDDVPEAS